MSTLPYPGMTTPSSPPLTNCGSNPASSSSPMMSTFKYISSKLAHRNMHLEFILDDISNNDDNNQGCILIPLRPLSRPEQSCFTKISSKAQKKFPSFRVQARCLDRGALASSSSQLSASFSQDPHAAATNEQSRQNSRTRTTKHECIFQVIDPIHLLQQSNIPHHVVFHADGLLVLTIDSSSSSSSPSLNDGEEEAEEAEEEGEEFILHSFSPWSSCGGGPGGGGGGGDVSDGAIYGFGLRDYFRNINPRLGLADDSILTTTDAATTDIHESEAGVVSRRRDNDINTAAVVKSANRKPVETRPRLRFSKGKEVSSSSSSSLFNSRNKAYPSSPSSSLLQPLAAAAAPVTAPLRDTSITTTTNTATAAASGSSSSNKHFFEFALSEYPLYRHDNGLGGASTASASTLPAGAAGAGEYDPLSYLMEGGLEGQEDKMNGGGGEGEGGSMTTTMILGSEWEAFRRIGLGVGG